MENKEGTARDQREPHEVIPRQFLAQIEHRETGEYDERNDFLHRFQFRRVVDLVAVPIGGHREAIFDESDAPACNVCMHITVRSGTCYKCLNCGNSMGCS